MEAVRDEIGSKELLDRIERAVAAGEDITAIAETAGSSVAMAGDDAKLFIGDLACLVERQQGQDAIGRFAKTWGWPVDRVKEYRTVCRFYPRSVRDLFFENSLPIRARYSKLRIAKRFKDMELALDFIANGAALESNCEEFGLAVNLKLGKPTPAKKLEDFEASAETAAAELQKRLNKLENKSQHVHIKVYEVK